MLVAGACIWGFRAVAILLFYEALSAEDGLEINLVLDIPD